MKLLVILLCLLSERYLVHAISHTRFNWFTVWYNGIVNRLTKMDLSLNPVIVLFCVLFPILFLCALVLYLGSPLVFGIVGFILNLAIFYYCLGPINPFYPVREEHAAEYSEMATGNYLAEVCGQLFSVLFWYIVLGPLGALLYRLISLSRTQEATAHIATVLTNYLDWIPARLTVILYLLVGNCQRGLHFFREQVLSAPEENEQFLRDGGLLAARVNENEPVQMPQAESLVEHAIIVFLVLLAFFTLVALM
ncbi:MAG: regulatory signaling modulator protein AmpE [Tatlockia sp.]|jgi:AmpE protein